MRNRVWSFVLVWCVMVSVNVNANMNGPDIDGSIIVWADGGVIYWDDIADTKDPNWVSSYTAAAMPTISGRTVVFEYGGTQDLGGFNVDDPFWLLPSGPNNAAKQRYPEISGSRVVWQDYTDTATDPDIYMIDLTTSVKTTICNDAARQIYPVIDADIVAWRDKRSGDIYQIYWCSVSGETYNPTPIHLTGTEQFTPAVSGDLIVWTEDRVEEAGQEDTGQDIYGYDWQLGQEFPICTDLNDQSEPDICGDFVVFQDNNTDGGDYDIRVYNHSNGQIQTVADGSLNECYPAISGQTVAWQIDLTDADIAHATLAEPKQITLITPEPNDVLMGGSQAEIAWTTEGPIEQVTIEFTPDSGSNWQVIEPNVPAAAAYQWNPVADVDSTECQIRVSDFDDGEIVDTMAETFTIFQCDETLTADVTGDCFVGLADFAEMAAQWLRCGNPYDETWCFD